MSEFEAGYLEIQSSELVQYLLRENTEKDSKRIEPTQIVDFLKIDCQVLDLQTIFSEFPTVKARTPRALLSFHNNIIAIDQKLDTKRARFSVLHEIAHYVLPNHQYSLYVCDDTGFSPWTKLSFEKEANDFAADLLFMGDKFTLQANSEPICVQTVKNLAEQYGASFESTARRLIEKNFRPCMLIVFKSNQDRNWINGNVEQTWEVQYSIESKLFKVQYFRGITGKVPQDVVSLLCRPGVDISQSVKKEICVGSKSKEEPYHFEAEYFTNSYNIFTFLTPTK